MKCPVCREIDLKIAERQGVEIDYCPECRGVWLDRGELDKIIERSETTLQPTTHTPQPQTPQYQQPPSPQYQQPYYQQQHHGKPHHNDHGYGQTGYHKKKNWLSELFD